MTTAKRTKKSVADRSVKRRKPSLSKDDVLVLQNEILESPQNYNKIVELLEALDKKTLEEVHGDIASSLLRAFGVLAKRGVFVRNDGAQKHNAVVDWLEERYGEFKAWLVAALKSSATQDEDNQNGALAYSILMKLITIEHKYMQQDPLDTVQSLVRAVLESQADADDELLANLMAQDDLRYYSLKAASNICRSLIDKSDSNQRLGSKVVQLLLLIDKFPASDEDLSEFLFEDPPKEVKFLKTHKKVFQDAWLQGLRFVKSEAQYKAVLQKMHQRIIPNFMQPQLLLDFLTDCYDVGGSIALLALHGLFILIQYHHLDYPHFYTKLYNLFDSNVLHATYRSRLFRLVDLFLSSTHLPVAVMASFIKRIARLSLFAPPAAIVAVIPFIYNQLKRHPICMAMIHREDAKQGMDPYDEFEKDPLLTNALDSSLWELDTLRSHYHPNVAALAKIFSQPFRKPQYALEDFLDHSYRTLAASEKNRKLKAPPALEYEEFEGFDGYMKNWQFV